VVSIALKYSSRKARQHVARQITCVAQEFIPGWSLIKAGLNAEVQQRIGLNAPESVTIQRRS
jgi:hypothetical protein